MWKSGTLSYAQARFFTPIESETALQIGANRRNNGEILARISAISRCAGGWLAGTNDTANFVLPITLERAPQMLKRRKRDRDREERRRLAGPVLSLRERAYALASERAMARTRDFTAIGIPRHYLAMMCEEGLLVKVGYGVYRAADRGAS